MKKPLTFKQPKKKETKTKTKELKGNQQKPGNKTNTTKNNNKLTSLSVFMA